MDHSRATSFVRVGIRGTTKQTPPRVRQRAIFGSHGCRTPPMYVSEGSGRGVTHSRNTFLRDRFRPSLCRCLTIPSGQCLGRDSGSINGPMERKASTAPPSTGLARANRLSSSRGWQPMALLWALPPHRLIGPSLPCRKSRKPARMEVPYRQQPLGCTRPVFVSWSVYI